MSTASHGGRRPLTSGYLPPGSSISAPNVEIVLPQVLTFTTAPFTAVLLPAPEPAP